MADKVAAWLTSVFAAAVGVGGERLYWECWPAPGQVWQGRREERSSDTLKHSAR